MTDSAAAELRERIDALAVAISVRSLPRIVGTLLSTRLTLTQVKLLSTIVLAESITLSSLAEQSGVSLPTISKLVDRLSHVKLVERSADPDDQRVRRVRPTPLGRRVMGRIVGPHPALGADVIAGLSVDELRALETGMRAVNRELQRLASS